MRLKTILEEITDLYYHGTQYKIDRFDDSIKDTSKKTGGDEYSYGTYLTKDKSVAAHYAKRGGYIYTVKLSKTHNFLSDDKKVSKPNLQKIKNIIHAYNLLDTEGNNMSNSQKDYIMDTNIIKGHKNGIDLYNKIQRFFPITDKELSNLLSKSDVNGMVGNSGREFVIFDPKTIEIVKSEHIED